MLPEEFKQLLEEKGIQLSDHQVQQFETYYQLLVEWNQKVNLTAITDREEVYLKHFYDSLLPLWLVDQDFKDKSLVDVGSGAGFPSIPLLIVEPTLHVTIIDSLNKRIQFIQRLVEALGLEKQVQAIHARAEDAGQDPKYRQQFDMATARAVAALNILCEYCLPFVKKSGYFLALKGSQASDEVTEAEKAIKVLGAKYEETRIEALPHDEGERAIVVIRKTLETPRKYPRTAGKPNKKPIK